MSEIDNEITKYISVLEYKTTLVNNSFNNIFLCFDYDNYYDIDEYRKLMDELPFDILSFATCFRSSLYGLIKEHEQIKKLIEKRNKKRSFMMMIKNYNIPSDLINEIKKF